MRKVILSLLIVVAFCSPGFAQTQADKQVSANDAFKASLVSKLNISDDKASKIVVIENEFYTSAAGAEALPTATEAQRVAKQKVMHDAHVVRRSKLMELPLTGRQMEEVIELSANQRKKKGA